MALHHGSSEDGMRDTDANPFVGEANPAFGSRVAPPRQRLADDPVPSDVAYQVIHDELLLDGSARLNLATFVTTWMEVAKSRVHLDLGAPWSVDKEVQRLIGLGATVVRSGEGLVVMQDPEGNEFCVE
jgi:glutamate decarboxylase